MRGIRPGSLGQGGVEPPWAIGPGYLRGIRPGCCHEPGRMPRKGIHPGCWQKPGLMPPIEFEPNGCRAGHQALILGLM